MIEELSEIRWDVRPAPHLGTLENRVCDGVSTFDDLAALVALMHCLVVDLDTRLAAGETLPTMPPWHVQENKWRAARYGLDAIVILDAESQRAAGHRRPGRPARAAGAGGRRGSAARPSSASVADIPARGASYQRQRAVAERTDGDLVAVVDSVVRELRDGLGYGSVAALGLDHLQPDAEQPDRAVVLDPVEQRHRGLGEACPGRWWAPGRVRLRLTVMNGR